MYILKDFILKLVFPIYYFGVTYSKENNPTWYVLLVIYIIIVLIDSPTRWKMGQDKYSKLLEKGKIENASQR